MEWYYIGLIIIIGLFILIAVIVYLLRYKIMNWIMATVLGGYVVSPIDIIPDFIPVVGGIDDIWAIVGIIGFVINGIIMEFQNKKKDNKKDFYVGIYADKNGYLRFKDNNKLVHKSAKERKSKLSFFNRSKKNKIERRLLCKECGHGVDETEMYCKICGSKLNTVED